MIKSIYRHKNQNVVIWYCEHSVDVGPYSEDQMCVSYSYVYKDGRIGRERHKRIWESQFYEEFSHTDNSISVSAQIK